MCCDWRLGRAEEALLQGHERRWPVQAAEIAGLKKTIDELTKKLRNYEGNDGVATGVEARPSKRFKRNDGQTGVGQSHMGWTKVKISVTPERSVASQGRYQARRK